MININYRQNTHKQAKVIIKIQYGINLESGN